MESLSWVGGDAADGTGGAGGRAAEATHEGKGPCTVTAWLWKQPGLQHT